MEQITYSIRAMYQMHILLFFLASFLVVFLGAQYICQPHDEESIKDSENISGL